jgi:hypothetical protein
MKSVPRRLGVPLAGGVCVSGVRCNAFCRPSNTDCLCADRGRLFGGRSTAAQSLFGLSIGHAPSEDQYAKTDLRTRKLAQWSGPQHELLEA